MTQGQCTKPKKKETRKKRLARTKHQSGVGSRSQRMRKPDLSTRAASIERRIHLVVSVTMTKSTICKDALTRLL